MGMRGLKKRKKKLTKETEGYIGGGPLMYLS